MQVTVNKAQSAVANEARIVGKCGDAVGLVKLNERMQTDKITRLAEAQNNEGEAAVFINNPIVMVQSGTPDNPYGNNSTIALYGWGA